jgi:FkbM family methyltransferase
MSDLPKIPIEELEQFKMISNDVDIIFDIGSRDDLEYYKIKPNGEYHLFEPRLEFFNNLKSKVEKLENSERIYLNQVGLGHENIKGMIYYPNVQSFQHQWYKAGQDVGEKYDIHMLDDYVKDNNIDRIDFLKIDVEGFESNVLKGGLEFIKKGKVKFIQLEWNKSSLITEFVSLLENFNFYLMMEPRLLDIMERFKNKGVSNIDFNNSLIKLDNNLLKFVEDTIIPTGSGGNVLALNKKYNINNNMFFKIK